MFSWVAILGVGMGMIVAVGNVTTVNGFRSGWQGFPIFLVFAGYIGRIAHCKLVLHEDTLLVVNPIRTYVVPKNAIHAASVADDGTLEIQLDVDRAIAVYAFGGSLIDHFKGTSRKAARTISVWLQSSGRDSWGEGAAPQTRWTRCASADGCLILSAVTAGVGAIWMALSGS